jgi:predicted GNAT family acetyltransferase
MEFIKPFIYVPEYQLVDKLTEFFKDKLNEYSIRIMYRMTIDKLPIEFITNSKVLKLTKEILMNHLHDESELVKEEIWNRKKDEIEQGRQYVILSKNKIVSYCKISDICYGGGNIVVYTNENYRNLGYGKQVLQATINWCIANNILPVYWVWDKNLASIALAKSLGFQIKSEEIVVATIGKTNEDRRTS